MLDEEEIATAAEAFTDAIEATASDLAHDGVAGEVDFSGQLIGQLKARLSTIDTPKTKWRVGAVVTEREDGPATPSVRFQARQTSPHSEEPWSGADILMVLDIDTPDYKEQKGVLIQAKRLDSGKKLTPGEARRLRAQCGDMLDLTASSYVFLYAPNDVTILSATIVEGSERNDLHALLQWQAKIFFIDFVKCWIGDPRLDATNKQTLAVLRSRANARNAILVKASQET
jgi:hypothetical protein